jgi:hypothetical protein
LFFGAMENFLTLNQDHGAGSIYGKRNGSFVFLALNANTPAAAQEIIDKFRVSKQVSWNERYPGDKSIAQELLDLILGNIALTLITVGLALVGGVLIFLSRRAASRWFPKSSWGRPDEDTIIQLNLK